MQAVLGGQPELGICLGKYDFVIEFTSSSVMVASYTIKELQRTINKDAEMKSSASLYLCKELFASGLVKNRFPLHSYTFMRPSGLRYPPAAKLSEVVSAAGKLAGAGRIFWNSTSYSVVVKLDSKDARSLINGLVLMRNGLGNLVSESSTFFALSLGPRGLSHDVKSKDNFPCIIHAKVRQMDVNSWKNRKTMLGWSRISLGWFDLTFQRDFNSMNSAVQAVLAFRGQYHDVIETETVVIEPK